MIGGLVSPLFTTGASGSTSSTSAAKTTQPHSAKPVSVSSTESDEESDENASSFSRRDFTGEAKTIYVGNLPYP